MKAYRNAMLQLVFLIVLLFQVWVIVKLVQWPSIGVFWGYSNGIVYAINPETLSSVDIRVGDRIISGDGLTPAEIYQMVGKKPGDLIDLQIERGSNKLIIPVLVTTPPLKTILSRLTPLLIAIVFWASGSIVFAFSRGGSQPILFFLACQAAAISLGSGLVSSIGPIWVKSVLNVSMVWTGSFAALLHFRFPTRIIGFHNRKHDWMLLAVSSLISVIYLAGSLFNLIFIEANWYRLLPFLIFIVDLIAVALLLIRSFRKAETAAERNQAGSSRLRD